ncbi:MAG: cation diffusion facilitator family transporter [Microlunatus sp.]|nr:cation diffusion facilitator family transporter [Microlunatus sp.]
MSDHSTSDPHDHGDHEHGHHEHPGGLKGFLHGLFVPHSHDAADSVDDALEASRQGVRAVKISLGILGVTALLQVVVVIISGSVALLADTVHNFSDALTAVPLWVAFVIGRQPASRRYTYGFGRIEDLAGLFIVAMIALSAVVAGVESIRRFFEPQPVTNLGWVLAAGLIGFAGNELVAVYRIRVGRRIGSAALVADGVHARTDGFTSLAVVAGVIGIWLGFPLADPIVGLVISAAIVVLLIGTSRDIGRRLLDGVDPGLVEKAESTVASVPGIDTVDDLRMRWSGHRLLVEATVSSDPTMPVGQFHELEHQAADLLRKRLPRLDTVRLTPAAHPNAHDHQLTEPTSAT